MFHAAGNISAQLVYFRGWNGETRASQWFDNPMALADAMSKITCVAGHTQIEKVLKHAARERRPRQYSLHGAVEYPSGRCRSKWLAYPRQGWQ